MNTRKFTRNGDNFEADDLFAMARGLTTLADHFHLRGAKESSVEYLRLAQRLFNEYGDYHSATECRKKMFEWTKSYKHMDAATITSSAMSVIERMHPDTLRFTRKENGVYTATAHGDGKRPSMRFVLEKQGASWKVKTSKAVQGHGFVPEFFDTAASYRDAKLACERRLIAANDAAAEGKRA